MPISTPIYKRDTSGRIRTWQYEVEGDSYRTIAGIQGGSLVTSGWTKCHPKNEGKANATTAEIQAVNEAVAEMGKKLKREYRLTIDELDSVPAGPMLAHDYAKLKKPLIFPVYSQPKLDGIRAIINRHGAFSRELQPHYNCDHILSALAPVFEKHPDLVFDGEFYNHHLKDDFNKIVSIVRKQNPTNEQKAEAKTLIQYHIYDIPGSANFGSRIATIRRVFGDFELWDHPHLKYVFTDEAADQDRLDLLNGAYTEQGYEGQMIRLNKPYDFDTRSKSLLKRKEFQTAEFPVSRVIEGNGNWSGCAKAIEYILPEDKRLENGDRPQAGIRGSRDFAKKLLEESLAGRTPKETTIRFFDYTPAGIPRFPVAIDFHENGRID